MSDRWKFGARSVGLFVAGFILLAIASAFGGSAPADAMPCHQSAGVNSPLPDAPETVAAAQFASEAVPAVGGHGTMSCCTFACGHSAVATSQPVLSRPTVRRSAGLPRLVWTPQQARLRLDRPPRAPV